MARRRMIDPEIWSDRKLMQCSLTAQVLFIGMFSHADDEGRLAADTADLKRAIFGYNPTTPEEIEAALDELRAACKSLAVYHVDGDRYVAFRKWEQYQYVQRAKPSKIPPPPALITAASDTKPAETETNHSTLSDESDNTPLDVTDESRTSIAQISIEEESKNTGEAKASPGPADAGHGARANGANGAGAKPETPPPKRARAKPPPSPAEAEVRQMQRATSAKLGRAPYGVNNAAYLAHYRALGEDAYLEALDAYRRSRRDGEKWDDLAVLKYLDALTAEPTGPPRYVETF
jgi:hypothetical protein